jgi:hypothetical protein
LAKTDAELASDAFILEGYIEALAANGVNKPQFITLPDEATISPVYSLMGDYNFYKL